MKNIVLIVDDSPMNIHMLTGILGDEHHVLSALSGKLAIEIMEVTIPDLVLLDVIMPGLGGFEVIRYMKENKRLAHIPVIFVTGESGENEEERGLALGAVDYIKKPYSAAIIRVRVHNHLELKNYRDNLKQLVLHRTEQLEERTKQLANRSEQLTASYEAIIMAMSLISESRDKVTGEHIERIKRYTRILTEKLIELYPREMSVQYANSIILFSPLHDLGKNCIPDSVLKKTGILTPEEFEIMKRHTNDGGELLRIAQTFLVNPSGSDNLDVAIEIAESHHERYDGSGYPRGLKGDEIPMSARIVAVADVYDAIRSKRPYKKEFTHEETVNIILSGDGRTCAAHFDPKVLQAFRMVQREFMYFNESDKEDL